MFNWFNKFKYQYKGCGSANATYADSFVGKGFVKIVFVSFYENGFGWRKIVSEEKSAFKQLPQVIKWLKHKIENIDPEIWSI